MATAMANLTLSHFDGELLRDPYSCMSAEDLVPKPPDPLSHPSRDAIARYGPLDPAALAGPHRYAESYDPVGLLPSYEIYEGNATEVLNLLAGDTPVNSRTFIYTVLTSVPYFRLKHYGDRSEELGWGSLDDYIASLCDVFDSVPLNRRGSTWVNIGDTRDKRGGLMGVPDQFRIAMQKRGWLVADNVVWAKVVANSDGTTEGNCMPEPAPGRLNGNGHESLYRFVRGEEHRLGGLKKIQDAWTDAFAISVPRQGVITDPTATRYLPEQIMSVHTSIEGRSLPNVWLMPPGKTREAHFATYQAALCERPIAMTGPLSVCTLCRQPRERLVDRTVYDDGRPPRRTGKYRSIDALGAERVKHESGRQDNGRSYVPRKPVTSGWSCCACGWNWMPGTILDPFAGTSSTGYSALRMGRNFIGIDLYTENCRLSVQRCESALDLLREKNLVPALLQR
jgi:site-specific DNA-methyltransferase (adenine-specific)